MVNFVAGVLYVTIVVGVVWLAVAVAWLVFMWLLDSILAFLNRSEWCK